MRSFLVTWWKPLHRGRITPLLLLFSPLLITCNNGRQQWWIPLLHVATMGAAFLLSTMVIFFQQWVKYRNNGCFLPLLCWATMVLHLSYFCECFLHMYFQMLATMVCFPFFGQEHRYLALSVILITLYKVSINCVWAALRIHSAIVLIVYPYYRTYIMYIYIYIYICLCNVLFYFPFLCMIFFYLFYYNHSLNT